MEIEQMKSINTYYTGKKELISFIDDAKIQNTSSLLIQVFSALTDRSFIETLLSELTDLFPDAVIIGSTTDGEIMNGKVSSGKVVLNFTQFEKTTLKASAIEHSKDGYFSGQYLAKELIEDDTKLLIAFVDGLHTNGEAFLSGIDSVNDEIIVTGGHAGDNSQFKETLVFTKEHIYSQGAVAVSLSSKHLHIHTDYRFNWHPIGNELTITKAEGNRVYTIDGKSAVDTYAHYLGEGIAKGLPSIGIEFPLIVNRNGVDVSRAAIAKVTQDGSLIVGGNLYTGEKVRIGYGDAKEILSKSQKIVENTSKEPSEAIFVYSCSTRKYFMDEEVESETLPLQAIAPVAGFFTYGEFFTSDKKELFNQTMTLVSLSESDTVHKVNTKNETAQLDINHTSMNGLTRLINISNKEVQEESESIKAKNQLNKIHKERMELALLGTNEGVWDWNIVDNTVYFSPRWKEMIGYNDHELPNELSTWADNVHPDDIDDTWADVHKNVNGETEFYENIHRLKHKNGSWVRILDRGKTQYDQNGKAIRMIGTHVDISKEIEQQQQLDINSASINGLTHLINVTSKEVQEQTETIKETNKLNEHLKERMELALLGSKTSVLDWDFTDSNMYISPSWKEMLGYQDDELSNSTYTWQHRVHPEDQKNIVSQLRESDKKQLKYFENTHRLKHKDGHWVWVLGRAQIMYDVNGRKIRMVGTHTDITEEKELQLKYDEQKNILRYQAHYDALTGLPNRVLFTDRIKHGIKTAKRHKTGFALFFIDLDKFKNINDSLGHDVGDKVLQAVAKRLKSVIRKEDTLSRLSGDEFTVIMEDLHHPEDASILSKKILKHLAEPIYIDNDILYVTGSIGISLYPQDATEAKYLLKYADTAMYKAKEEGRNNFQFYSSDMTKLALEHMLMKTSLQQAIDNDEFVVYYQPQVNIVTNEIVGIEALVRWQHSEKGLLLPDAFIPLAEETGIIVKIDQFVMKTAMKQIAKWYKEGLHPGVLAVNLSIKQLECYDFLQKIKERIEKYNFKPQWLELEITEGQMIKKPEEIIHTLAKINDVGINISIDDFGTGYSSLSILKRLPIHRLKIDRSFVRDIPEDEEDVAIVKAIIALAESLNLDLIAEGVETSEQKEFLIDNHCKYVQGYLYSEPLSADEMKRLLLKEKQ